MTHPTRSSSVRPRRSIRPRLVVAFMSAILAAAALCPAQSRAADPLLDVDVITFLQARDVLDFQANTDPVWDLHSGFNRRLISIPFTINTPANEITLDNTSIKMSNATFVGWRIEGIPTHGVVVQSNATDTSAPVEKIARSYKQLAENTIVGSAFAVSSDGFLLTSNHVLADIKKNERDLYVLINGTAFPAIVIESSSINDIALLKIDGVKDLGPMPFQDSSKIQPNQAITALGYPKGSDATRDANILVGSILDTPSDAKGDIKLFELDFKTDPGLAGGPIIDDKGQVIAIIGPNIKTTRELTKTSVVLAGNHTRTILDRFGIKPETANPNNSPGASNIGINASKSVFPVLSVSRSAQGPAAASTVARVPLDQARAESAPLIARKITIDPTGHLRWTVEHAIPNGAIRETGASTTKLYTLRLKRELLAKLAPAPISSTRGAGETDAAYSSRMNDYRQKQATYRELRSAVNDTPENLEITPYPARVWAIFDVNQNSKDFTLDASPTIAPFPWTITFQQISSIRGNLTPADVVNKSQPGTPSGGGGVANMVTGKAIIPDANADQVVNMIAMMTTNQPINARACAYVISFTDMLRYASIGNNVYNLTDSVVKSNDLMAIKIIIKQFYTTIPSSPDNVVARTQLTGTATKRIAELAAQGAANGINGGISGVNNLEIEILKNSFETPNPNAAQLAQQVPMINKSLASPTGAPPAEIINMVTTSARKNPDSLSYYANGVQFDAMPDDRRDQAICRIVELSPTEPVCQFWLNQRLLGSADPTVVRRTLDAIQSADTNNRAVAGMAGSALDAVFGPAPVSVSKKLQVKLAQPIPLDSASHGILRTLSSSDAAVRAAGWDAILRFTIVGKASSAPAVGAAAAAPGTPAIDTSAIPEIYRAIMESAFSQGATPPQLVDFLTRQTDQAFVLDSLIKIVLQGTDKASAQATKAILRARRNDWQIDQAMLGLSFGEREGFAKRLFENTGGYVPLTTPLLRQRIDRNPLVIWFASCIAAGQLPSNDQWAKPAGNEDAVLNLIGSVEPDIALSAVAALVYNVGGDDRAVRDAASKFRLAPKQDLATFKGVWAVVKRDIYAARIAKMSGPYRLTIAVTQGKAPANSTVPLGKIDLGVVQLTIEGLTVKVTDRAVAISMLDEMGIGFDKASDLSVFKNADLESMSISKSASTIDMLPRKNGGWSGIFAAPDGHQLEVIFSPVR